MYLLELYVKTFNQIYQYNTLWLYDIFMKNIIDGKFDYLLISPKFV
jgi:hypothetical protein